MSRIIMVFEDEMNKRLEAFSQECAQGMISEYVLGHNSIPHITIYSWKPSGDINQEIDMVRQIITPLLPSKIHVDLDGFYQSPRSTKTYFGMRVQLTQELVDLNAMIHEKLMLEQDNGAGVGYFPHVTLGCAYHQNFKPNALKFDIKLGQENTVPVKFMVVPTSEHGRVIVP